MDRKVGQVIDALKDRGEYNRTLIIFTSDNGGCMPAENRGCNWPMRGGKHHLFEGGIKVTSFVSGGALPTGVRGSTSHALMHATDWFPTVMGFVEDFKSGHSTTTSTNPTTGGTDHHHHHHNTLDLDGVDMWSTLTNVSNLNTSTIDPEITYSPRREIPHNVDPLLHATGLPTEPQGAIRLDTYVGNGTHMQLEQY